MTEDKLRGIFVLLPIGTLINVSAILVGSITGTCLGRRIPEKVQKIVFYGLGMCVAVLGIRLSFECNFTLMAACIAIGGIAGELLKLEERIISLGNGLKNKLKSGNPNFTEGFVTATVIFCVGAMTILGPFQEALDGDRTLLYTKSMLDLFTSLMLASSFGIGVAMSFLPLMIYQMILFYFASYLAPFLSGIAMELLMGAGGVMILCVSLTLLDIKKIPVANFLPALPIAVVVGNIIQG